MRRLPILLILSALALAVLAPAAAEASRVHKLRPWKAGNRYLVTTDLDGRKAPQLDPRAKIDFLRKGQWVRIKCQAVGQSAYGSTLWDKVGRYYVPDHYLKTYTDGRIPGAPACGAEAPPPPPHQPPAFPSSPPLPSPQGGYGSYSQTYALGTRFKGWSYQEMTNELRHHFSRYFSFQGCGKNLKLGKTCRLHAPGPDGPVKVIALTPNGFGLRSLSGHPEGAGRTITFRWARWCNVMSDYTTCGHTYLQVDAWGPVSNASLLGPLNALTIARHYWTKFSANIRARYPKCPPGKLWSRSEHVCGVII